MSVDLSDLTLRVELARRLGLREGEIGSREDVDATRLCEAAVRHGVCGLLVEQASRARANLPDVVERALRRHAVAAAGLNMHLEAELERIVEVLASAGISCMLLKGAALNRTVYDRADLRPVSDIDLLVNPREARRAVDTLIGAGCRRGLHLLREDFFPEFYYELELLTASSPPARIDLHAHPFRPLRLSRTITPDAFWHGAGRIKVGGNDAAIPSPETMFIHLAAHSAFHGNERLIWLYDLVRWSQVFASRIDWDRVVAQAESWGLSLAVASALEAASAVFDAGAGVDRREPGGSARFALDASRKAEPLAARGGGRGVLGVGELLRDSGDAGSMTRPTDGGDAGSMTRPRDATDAGNAGSMTRRTDAGSACAFVPEDVVVALHACRTGWRDRLMLRWAPRDASAPTLNVVINVLITPGLIFRLRYLLALVRPGQRHLAGLYPFRHRGWVVCAYVWRAARALGRMALLPRQFLVRTA